MKKITKNVFSKKEYYKYKISKLKKKISYLKIKYKPANFEKLIIDTIRDFNKYFDKNIKSCEIDFLITLKNIADQRVLKKHDIRYMIGFAVLLEKTDTLKANSLPITMENSLIKFSNFQFFQDLIDKKIKLKRLEEMYINFVYDYFENNKTKTCKFLGITHKRIKDIEDENFVL
jgi:hypothetical protein